MSKLKTFQITFDDNTVRTGIGNDVISAICTAVGIANAEASALAITDNKAAPKKLSSRNVVKVLQLGHAKAA